MADQKPSNRERVKEIVSSIEQNIQDLFQSERYFDYLRTMSRFLRYVFDVADTGGGEETRPKLWKYREEYQDTV